MRLGFRLEVIVFTLVGNDDMPGIEAMRTSALELDNTSEELSDSTSAHGLHQREGVTAAPQGEKLTSLEKPSVRRISRLATSPSSVLQKSGANSAHRDRSARAFALKELVPRQSTILFIGCALGVSIVALCCVGLVPLIHQSFSVTTPQWGHDPSAMQSAHLEAQIDAAVASRVHVKHASEEACNANALEVPAPSAINGNTRGTEHAVVIEDATRLMTSIPTTESMENMGASDDEAASEEPPVGHERTWKASQVLKRVASEPRSEQAVQVRQVLKRASQNEGDNGGAKKIIEAVRRLSGMQEDEEDARIDYSRVQSCGGNDRELEELLRGASEELRSSLARMHSKSSLGNALSPTNSAEQSPKRRPEPLSPKRG